MECLGPQGNGYSVPVTPPRLAPRSTDTPPSSGGWLVSGRWTGSSRGNERGSLPEEDPTEGKHCGVYMCKCGVGVKCVGIG